MALTYTAIATVTVGSGGASSIDFNSIPGTYTDLLIKCSLRQSGYTGVTWDWLKFRFNGSSATVYSSRDLEGAGTLGPATNTFTSQNGMVKLGLANSTTSSSNTFSSNDIYIPNYAGSYNKSAAGDGAHEDNTGAALCVMGAGLWSNTAAITSITLFPENGTAWVQHSSATLYGIKNTV
jgi:hypothetical protein